MGLFSFLFGEPQKSQSSKVYADRDFYVNRENLLKRLIDDYNTTTEEFNDDYKNIARNYYQGADTILHHFKFCIEQFKMFSNNIQLYRYDSGAVDISFTRNIYGNPVCLSYYSEPWYKQNGVLHRVCSLSYGNEKLRYDITSGRWDDWWKYSSYDEEIYADVDGVKKRNK